tara:strand:- start:11817 stop:11972 length:156 start_codon:yes stop_codon:yes gene_type:complete
MGTEMHPDYLRKDIEFLLAKLNEEKQKVLILTDLKEQWKQLYTDLAKTHSS